MIRLRLADRTLLEIPREDAFELLPYRNVLANPSLKSPIDGLMNYRGRIIPVLGPLPSRNGEEKSVDERPWLLLMKGCAQVVIGLPEFQEEAPSNVVPIRGDSAVQDPEELIKIA